MSWYHCKLASSTSVQASRKRSDVDVILSEYGTLTSIHAPRKRSDHRIMEAGAKRVTSIHAPRKRSDKKIPLKSVNLRDFNPRSPKEERLTYLVIIDKNTGTSIHAPRKRSDTYISTFSKNKLKLQSTLPERGATTDKNLASYLHIGLQSTLPERGATTRTIYTNINNRYFNPRSPKEERRNTNSHSR